MTKPLKYLLLSISLILLHTHLFGQISSFNSALVNSIPNQVKIIGLGDPTHQESTITNYRIDLIKQLVKKKHFSIIGLESNFYEIYKGYKKYLNTGDYKHIEESVYGQLNSSEMEDLYQYIYQENKQGNPVKLFGFDIAFSGRNFTTYFKEDLISYTSLTSSEITSIIKDLEKAQISNLKVLLMNRKKLKSRIKTHCQIILSKLKSNSNTLDAIIFKQAVYNLHSYFTLPPLNKRDMGMANNIKFLNKHYPNEKIILFGSNTHLLKQPKSIDMHFFKNDRITFGDLLYKTYHKSYYFIGYTAISGYKYNFFGKKSVQIKPAKALSIEQMVENSTQDKATFINSKLYPLKQPIASRFMGHAYVNLLLWDCIDALVLIKDITPCQIKYNLDTSP